MAGFLSNHFKTYRGISYEMGIREKRREREPAQK